MDWSRSSQTFSSPIDAVVPSKWDNDDDDDILKYLNFPEEENTNEEIATTVPTSPEWPGDDFDFAALDEVMEPLLLEYNGADGTSVEDMCGFESSLQLWNNSNVVTKSRVWISTAHLDCSCCHVLRELIHSNGVCHMKLVLHGGLGVFHHAILELYHNVDGLPPAMEQSYIDLSTQNLEEVKAFLVDYFVLRHHDKFVITQDSLSSFYDALCTTINFGDARNFNEENASSCNEKIGLCRTMTTEAESNNRTGSPKIGISIQRERARRLHIRDLAAYFHLPIVDAAKELKICSTALKKVCRRYGMTRWPHRKIKCIDRMIAQLQNELNHGVAVDVVNTRAQIQKLFSRRSQICGGLLPSLDVC